MLLEIMRKKKILSVNFSLLMLCISIGILQVVNPFSFFFFFSFIFIKLITLQYCSGFCHTLTWTGHGFTCVPHPDPPTRPPLHLIPLGLPSAPALSTGVSCCDAWTLECTVSIIVTLGFSCPAAHMILLPDHGLNSHPLQWIHFQRYIHFPSS